MEYRTRLPGGKIQVVKFDKTGKREVTYEPPKKKKSEK